MPGILLGSSVRIEASGGGACDTERHNTDGSDDEFIDFTSYTRIASQFTAGATYTNCKVALALFKIGTPNAGNISVSIYTDSSNTPGTQIGTPSGTIGKSAITAAFGDYTDFTGISASLTNGTVYWVVVESSTLDTDGSNCIVWVSNAGAIRRRGWDGASWFDVGDKNQHFILYST